MVCGQEGIGPPAVQAAAEVNAARTDLETAT